MRNSPFYKAGESVWGTLHDSLQHAEGQMTDQQKVEFWRGLMGSSLGEMSASIGVPRTLDCMASIAAELAPVAASAG